MKKYKKVITLIIAILCVCSLCGVAFATSVMVGGIEMYNIGIQINVNGEDLAHRTFTEDRGWDELEGEFWVDEEYTLDGSLLTIPLEVNTSYVGSINTYQRFTFFKYFLDGNGNRISTSGDIITLNTANIVDNGADVDGFIYADDASASERGVYYYNALVSDTSPESPLLLQSVTVDTNKLLDYSFTEEFDSNGRVVFKALELNCTVQIEGDAVQDSNAESAIATSWAANVSISDGRLSYLGKS